MNTCIQKQPLLLLVFWCHLNLQAFSYTIGIFHRFYRDQAHSQHIYGIVGSVVIVSLSRNTNSKSIFIINKTK